MGDGDANFKAFVSWWHFALLGMRTTANTDRIIEWHNFTLKIMAALSAFYQWARISHKGTMIFSMAIVVQEDWRNDFDGA